MRIRCFLIEHTGRVRHYLQSYNFEKCPAREHGYHSASAAGDTGPMSEDGIHHLLSADLYPDDPRWPTTCKCGYVFTAEDSRNVCTDSIWRRVDTGEELELKDVPAGAMWFSPWHDRFYTPQLEHCLCVKLPDGTEWCIDGRATNCTLPGNTEHHCWVIEGTPPDITAGKAGPTCSAGAGSIQTHGYHGFLRNGWLES